MLYPGDTFLATSGRGGKEHLWIVIAHVNNYPQFGDKNALIVSFTTRRDDCDETCIIKPGEHPDCLYLEATAPLIIP